MQALNMRGETIAANGVARVTDALVAAADDLPPGLQVERLDDGIAIRGPGLLRQLAFDGRLRALTLALRSSAR